MATGSSSPTWLRDGCPPWCVREHRETDHPEDHVHRSEAHLVPAVLRARVIPTEPDRARAVELVVQLFRTTAPTAQTWVEISDGEGGAVLLTLSVESSARLALALTDVVT